MSLNYLKINRKVSAPVVLMILAVLMFGCNNGGGSSTSVYGDWIQKTSISQGARYGAVLFNIGGVTYVTTGYNGNSNKSEFLSDMKQYSAASNSWTDTTAFPGAPRKGAVAFTINGIAYVGLGQDLNNFYNDFYSFDPATGEWTRIEDFPDKPRTGSFAFSIGDFGYVGDGSNDDGGFLECYKYDPTSGHWSKVADVPNVERSYPFSFVIDGKGYVGGGVNNGSLVFDFYEYDPEANTWTALNDLRDDTEDDDTNDKGYTIARSEAVTFVIDGKAYVTGGKRGGLSYETWEYTPGTDTWKKFKAFEGTARFGAVGYSDAGMGYVLTGFNGSSLYFNDKWQFDPTVVTQ